MMDVLANHRTLSKCNAAFVESMLTQQTGELTQGEQCYGEQKQSGKSQSEQGVTQNKVSQQRALIRGGEIPVAYEMLRQYVNPWPVIVGSKYKSDMAQVTGKIGQLLYKSNVIMARDYPALFNKQYDLPIEWFNTLDENAPEGQFMVGRYDALISRGALKLVEYNAGTNIGGWHLYRLVDRYREVVQGIKNLDYTPILDAFLSSLHRMIESKVVPGKGADSGDNAASDMPYHVLFVLENENEKNDFVSSLPYFEEAMNACRLNVKLHFDVDFQQLDVNDEGAWINGDKMDALSVPVFDIDASSEKVQKLMQLHWQNKVVFPDNPIYLSAGNKSCFANVYFLMQQNKLTQEEAQLISQYIPWTHHLDDEVLQLTGQSSAIDITQLQTDKANYVIKRDGLLGGDHVYVGRFTSDSTWESVLSLAQKNPGWIVQKYFASDAFYASTDDDSIVPHDYIFGFFDTGSHYGGAGVRIMPSKLSDGVVNSAKGANYTMVFEQQQKMLTL